MPFRKGQSGNPGGRPKQDLDVVQLCRSVTKEAIEKQIAIMRLPGDNPKLLAVQAMVTKNLIDRGWGTSPQTVLLQGDTTIRIETPLTRRKEPDAGPVPDDR